MRRILTTGAIACALILGGGTAQATGPVKPASSVCIRHFKDYLSGLDSRHYVREKCEPALHDRAEVKRVIAWTQRTNHVWMLYLILER